MPNSVSDVTSASAAAIESISASASASSASTQGGAAVAEQSAAPTDATNLSPLGTLLGTTIRGAQAQSPVRPDVVARIRSQLDAGTYQPDRNAVAASVYRAIKASQ